MSTVPGGPKRRHRLDAPEECPITTAALHVEVPDAAAFDRLAASGLLSGDVRELRVRVANVPVWLRAGLRPPRPARDSTAMAWSVRDDGIEVRLGWRSRKPISRAFAEASMFLLRPRHLDQLGGPLHVADRAGWLSGDSTWPHAVLDAKPASDQGPFLASPGSLASPGGLDSPGSLAGSASHDEPAGSLSIALANPHRRVLFGRATSYFLTVRGNSLVLGDSSGKEVLVFTSSRSVEGVLLDEGWSKYSTVTVPSEISGSAADPKLVSRVLLGLAACGAVLVSTDGAVHQQLAGLGLPCVDNADLVDDLTGYQLSLSSSRSAQVMADPVLRRTQLLAGSSLSYGKKQQDNVSHLQLPAISVLVPSKRESDVIACLGNLASQTYPSYEVIVGTHGYALADEKLAELRERMAAPLRVVEVPPVDTLGAVLGRLSRLADGELISKVDDDDYYGAEHLTDLFLASRTSGADLVAKAARFVQLVDEGVTVDRGWASVEAFEVTLAGGTLLLSRATLQTCGGWSESPRHVDADLVTRIHSAGGITYRTHGLGYVYVRRSSGHTWQADSKELAKDGERRYDGLPSEILAGGQI